MSKDGSVFKCYGCKSIFDSISSPLLHFDEDEIDDEGEVSLCDSCSNKLQKKALELRKESEISRRFFKPRIENDN